ncbi:MAG: hypothetical protein ACPGYL_14530, partial [Rhodospirillaceae bacterium]
MAAPRFLHLSGTAAERGAAYWQAAGESIAALQAHKRAEDPDPAAMAAPFRAAMARHAPVCL